MAHNPKLETAVLDEITSFHAAHRGQVLTTADYDERPICLALLAECLRRYPPVPAVARTSSEEGEVPPDPVTHIGGFKYPAGAEVIASVIGVHHDPERWPDPEAFRIERWLEGANENMSVREKGRIVRGNIRAREQAMDWLPFSDGPGRCPGQHFNAHEFLIVMDSLVPRYRFELADPHKNVIESETMIVGPEQGTVAVRIRKRSQSAQA